jgi:amino acid transporter
MNKINKLNTIALILLITGAIDSIRNLPAAALFGSSLIFFFILAAIIFLIPTALVSADLSANIKEGGIYQWVQLAFGKRLGFLAVWLQWINNIVWFPTILSFVAGTAAYLFDPALAQNKIYLVTVILSAFWLLTFINLKGISFTTQFTSWCAIIGLLIPMCCLFILLFTWLIMGHPIQIHFTHTNILPNWQNTDNWVALTAIMTGFTGMELATVHINEVKDPQKTFPRALVLSTIIILIMMMIGALAIACVIPGEHINLVNGVIQTFAYFLAAYHLTWLIPICTGLIVIGGLGSVVSWVISPIKGLSEAAKHGFLPTIFKQTNTHGMPKNLLILQAVLVSLSCLAFLLLPSVNGSYWLLSALSTQLYMLMYVLMFTAALYLRKNGPYHKGVFAIPGKKIGLRIICILGLIGCFLTLLVGFIPPHSMNVGSYWYYEMLFISGMLIMTAPVLFFYWYESQYRQKTLNQATHLSQPILTTPLTLSTNEKSG